MEQAMPTNYSHNRQQRVYKIAKAYYAQPSMLEIEQAMQIIQDYTNGHRYADRVVVAGAKQTLLKALANPKNLSKKVLVGIVATLGLLGCKPSDLPNSVLDRVPQAEEMLTEWEKDKLQNLANSKALDKYMADRFGKSDLPDITLSVGKTKEYANLIPKEYLEIAKKVSHSNITWKSSNSSIFVAQSKPNGKVMLAGSKKGKATLTAKDDATQMPIVTIQVIVE